MTEREPNRQVMEAMRDNILQRSYIARTLDSSTKFLLEAFPRDSATERRLFLSTYQNSTEAVISHRSLERKEPRQVIDMTIPNLN